MTNDEIEVALTHAVDARNRYCNRSGYSAHRRVFGSSLRLPGCFVSDDMVDRFSVSCDPTTEFQRSAEIRSAAQRAMLKNMDVDAINKAVAARSRLPPRDKITQGMIVYVWRSSPRSKVRGWVGPGVVICVNPQQTSVWVSMRGVVVKCSMDRVRRATDDE